MIGKNELIIKYVVFNLDNLINAKKLYFCSRCLHSFGKLCQNILKLLWHLFQHRRLVRRNTKVVTCQCKVQFA